MRPVRRGFSGDPKTASAFGALMEEVFGRDMQLGASARPDDAGISPFGIYDSDGACIAGLELVALSLTLEGIESQAAGVASVAVAPAFRGRGLFKLLMQEALACCGRPVLLYTEDPSLYTRFGFGLVPQHRFEGPAPMPQRSGAPARWFSPGPDGPLLNRLLATKTPVSNQATLDPGAAIVLRQIAGLDDYALDYLPDQDALVIWSEDGGTFTLAGVFAGAIPPLAVILGALNQSPDRIEVLFPPDKLGWDGAPVADDAGLMMLGNRPASFARPFRFAPTAEF